MQSTANVGAARAGDAPILVVEDDVDSREMLRELFAMLGRETLLAADAEEALRIAGESKLDVAFIDLGLGDTDGCELARRLRASAEGQPLRLIALTGYSDPATRSAAAEAGFDAFLVKPIVADNLAALLKA